LASGSLFASKNSLFQISGNSPASFRILDTNPSAKVACEGNSEEIPCYSPQNRENRLRPVLSGSLPPPADPGEHSRFGEFHRECPHDGGLWRIRTSRHGL
jgi:hypothetical protein